MRPLHHTAGSCMACTMCTLAWPGSTFPPVSKSSQNCECILKVFIIGVHVTHSCLAGVICCRKGLDMIVGDVTMCLIFCLQEQVGTGLVCL